MGNRLAIPMLVLLIVASGCRDSLPADKAGAPAHSASIGGNPRLKQAQLALSVGDHSRAMSRVREVLLRCPSDLDAILLAARIDADQGNSAAAIASCECIPLEHDRLGLEAATLRYQQWLRMGNDNEAEGVLLELLAEYPSQPAGQRDLWELWFRQGRHHEAVALARNRCFAGTIELDELALLVSPQQFSLTFAPSQFRAGLGLARWYHANNQPARALAELQEHSHPRNELAGLALQGRLLAEQRAFPELHDWHARCPPEVRRHADYWTALGILFASQREHEAAVGALLRAVAGDPTDDASYDLLAQQFQELGKHDAARQADFRSQRLAAADSLVTAIRQDPDRVDLVHKLARTLSALGRATEAQCWRATTNANAAKKGYTPVAHRASARQTSSNTATLGLSAEDFPVNAALKRILGEGGVSASPARPPHRSILAAPRFEDVSDEAGLDFDWQHDSEIDLSELQLHESLGGGMGVSDYDLDGWPDLYFAQGASSPPDFRGSRSNQLLRNCDGRFRAVTLLSGTDDRGYSTGIAVGDLNQDGFPDIIVGSLGNNRWMINNGDGTFSETRNVVNVTEAGPPAARFTTSLAIADLDGDALPDVYECNYIELSGAFAPLARFADGRVAEPSPLLHAAAPDRWMRSRGNGCWEVDEIDRQVARPGTSLAIVVTDFDGDPGNEVFVANDLRANHYLQRVDGGFQDLGRIKGVAVGSEGNPNGCMGIASGDFDGNGTLDLQVSNFMHEPANLYLQNRQGIFHDEAARWNLAAPTHGMVGFGTKALDFDRNGWIDCVTMNGHIFDLRARGVPFQMPPQCMMGVGGEFQIGDVTGRTGYWNKKLLGRTMALLDYDRDRAMDIVVNHLDHPTVLLRNQTTTPGHWIQFEFVGTTSERDAIGLQVTVSAANSSVSQWVTAGDGYFCTDQAIVDLGLGEHDGPVSVNVRWPGGKSQTFRDLRVDERYLVIENEDRVLKR